MINREITYKRDINSSYMIIPAMSEESFDEKRLLKRTMGNLLPIEKCYVAAVGQYWYNITGKQALDAYCRINSVGKDFFENLILKLCQIVEVLEWNLVDVNCLVLDPEMVFLNVYGEEVFFVAYPFHKGELVTELQQLLEYLLTKLNHQDKTVVEWAYKLYEIALTDGMSIAELKRVILEERAQNAVVSCQFVGAQEKYEEIQIQERTDSIEPEEQECDNLWDKNWNFWKKRLGLRLQESYKKIYKKVQQYMPEGSKKTNKMPVVVYPDEIEEEVTQVHPTVCIRAMKNAKRELRCSRNGVFPNFVLEQGAYIIGKNPRVEFRIEKDTISQFHARVENQGELFYIEDLNSTNGTYVNGQLLSYKSRIQLQIGDSIQFGDVEYRFC